MPGLLEENFWDRHVKKRSLVRLECVEECAVEAATLGSSKLEAQSDGSVSDDNPSPRVW